MTMSFPDMESLKSAAECHGFRQPTDNETEVDYRSALANHVTPRDRIEGNEIRTGKGWDEWNASDSERLFLHL